MNPSLSRPATCLAIVLAACSGAEPAAQLLDASDSLAVRAVYEQRIAGLDSGDLARWLAAHAADVRFVDPDQADIVGIDSLRAWGKPFFEQFTMKTGETVEELSVDGRRAFIRYSFAAEFTPKSGGAPIASRGKGLLLLRREQDGAWRITHNIWNTPTGLPK